MDRRKRRTSSASDISDTAKAREPRDAKPLLERAVRTAGEAESWSSNATNAAGSSNRGRTDMPGGQEVAGGKGRQTWFRWPRGVKGRPQRRSQPGTRHAWCKSLAGFREGPTFGGLGPLAGSGPDATAAEHQAEDQGATPAPHGLSHLAVLHRMQDIVRRRWRMSGVRPGVDDPRLPGGSAQTAWAPPRASWHSPTTGCRNRSSGAGKAPQKRPTP